MFPACGCKQGSFAKLHTETQGAQKIDDCQKSQFVISDKSDEDNDVVKLAPYPDPVPVPFHFLDSRQIVW